MEEFDEATLPLLFKAARCERTFQTTTTKKEQCRRMGQSACKGTRAQQQRLLCIFRGFQTGAMQEPKTVP